MVDIGREKISYEECQDEYGKKQGVKKNKKFDFKTPRRLYYKVLLFSNEA